tara:strand:+ start:1261 stop:2280 length:1020 start_codon:yes stop_codon:yes gene_type:complete
MKKPVTILTGFLGAGKTTFLNHLLEQNKDTRYAIIENEFGERGIDNELVIRPNESIVELNNGCLCCSINDNLYEILNELHERKDQFDELIIEATGVADPRGLAEPFIAHPLIKKHFPISAIICLIDSELVESQLEETEEAINQITFSDVLLINKTDLVSDDYVLHLESRLSQMNPLARLVKGFKSAYPQIDFIKESENLESIFQTKDKVNSINETLSFPVQKPHHHHHHKHTEEVNSETFIFNRPFDFDKLYHYLFVYLTFQSKGLYRMKGLVWLNGKDEEYVIQSVGKRFDIQEKSKWTATRQKQSTIVFIGKQLQRQGLEKLLKQCLASDYQNQKAS